MENDPSRFLPATREEMRARHWTDVDIVLVTGDAYVDHPSFGVALIGRWLEAHGYRVAVLSQPRHQVPDDFRRFGRPRLFFGITAGNLDSIVANYTGNAKVRDTDQYSPNNNPYFGITAERNQRRRPDRATIRYAQLARKAYPDVPLILGGLEASLRRFIHYDYQQARLRGSVLTDAKADLLVYGMGEQAVLDIAEQLARNHPLTAIAGTCERLTDSLARSVLADDQENSPLVIPGWEEIRQEKERFLAAELALDRHSRSLSTQLVLQQQQAMWVRQNPAAAPIAPADLDKLYALPFARAPHPTAGDVPAFHMIRDSITIVRGCSGNCSFCAITRHQGPVIISRSRESVLKEIRRVAAAADFSGTITDLGGPTANLYGTRCAKKSCSRHDCFNPGLCPQLHADEQAFVSLLQQASAVDRVKHLFVSSGLRMELLLKTPRLLTRLLLHHTPGAMKIAPEHTEKEVLRLMHKPGSTQLARFVETCRRIAAQHGRPIHFIPYLIASHPGCTVSDMQQLARTMQALRLPIRQFQDFTPTPGTLATAMYVTELDRDSGKPIHVAKGATERRRQRQILETLRPKSTKR